MGGILIEFLKKNAFVNVPNLLRKRNVISLFNMLIMYKAN